MSHAFKASFPIAVCLCLASFISVAQTTKPAPASSAKPAPAGQAKAAPAGQAKAAPGIALKTELDSVAYGIGMSIAGSLKMQGLSHINTSVLHDAISQSLKENGTTRFSMEEANQLLMTYFGKKEDSLRKAEEARAEPNRLAGEAFLAENKKRDGVVTTASGLQYEVIKMGEGDKPKASDQVKTHYHGTLIDGTVFDSSVERGEPIVFPVGGVIKGWTEALQLMPVGSKWKLFIPFELAYGDRAAGPKIGAKSALIFEVELLEIIKEDNE